MSVISVPREAIHGLHKVCRGRDGLRILRRNIECRVTVSLSSENERACWTLRVVVSQCE